MNISPAIIDGDSFDKDLYEALEQAKISEPLLHSSFNAQWIGECGIDPKVIFDIGSYDAGDSIRLKHKYPESDVYSFEADPARITCIQKYISKFDIEFIPTAVCETTGQTNFYQSFIDGNALGQGSILKHTSLYKEIYSDLNIIQANHPIIVPSVSVSSFCKEKGINRVDVAHIDVEGAEGYVINGFGEIRPKLLFIETVLNTGQNRGWEGQYGVESEIHSILTGMGYVLIKDLVSDRLYLHHG